MNCLKSVSWVIVLCLGAASTAQDRKQLDDPDIARRLVGRWVWRPTSKMFVDITFAKDQTFTAYKGVGDLGYTASGLWKIDKGVLEVTTQRVGFGEQSQNVEKSDSQWSILSKSRVIVIDEKILKIGDGDKLKEFERGK